MNTIKPLNAVSPYAGVNSANAAFGRSAKASTPSRAANYLSAPIQWMSGGSPVEYDVPSRSAPSTETRLAAQRANALAPSLSRAKVLEHLESQLSGAKFESWVKLWTPSFTRNLELVIFPGSEAKADLVSALKSISRSPAYQRMARVYDSKPDIRYDKNTDSFNYLGRTVEVAEHRPAESFFANN